MMSKEEHYHQLMIIDFHLMIMFQDGHTKLFILFREKKEVLHTQKNGKNVGDESSSGLEEKNQS